MPGLYVASNTTALAAQFGLTRNMSALGDVLTRLSTGLKINSAKDDPAGLIASELLKAQITGTSKAITNTQRANSLIATADSSLNQIGNLLNDIKGLVVEAANTGTMTADQIAANQLQIDSALDSIDRIARITNYGGKKLLDGSLGFSVAGQSGNLSNVNITSANFGTASAIDVTVNVQQAADYARLISNGTGVSVDTILDVTGSMGSATINLGAGSTNDDIALAINKYADSTGVIAYVEGKAERGSVVLSSAGANNDIVITALEKGLDAGNYTFRITQGATNDVRIVSEPNGKTPGVVEIALVGSMETAYNNFAGLFNITIDNPNAIATSVNLTRGDSNKVQYFTTNTDSAGTSTTEGTTLTANAATSTSMLNGWTIVVDSVKGVAAGTIDEDNKTIYFDTGTNATANTGTALLAAVPGAGAVTFAFTQDMVEGERITLGNGGNAGELFIQYKAGATAGEIQAMINNAPGVQATLKSGVKASDVIPALPGDYTYEAKAATAATANPYVSGVTSQEVIDLINSKLGDKFNATALAGGGSGGRVSYMDAAVDWGDINLGNALRFTGMDNGPLVRLSTTNSDGSLAIDQKLGVRILQPSEADIKAGITTPILEIQLATDGQGNSITMASDIVKLFNNLTPAETLGVSVAHLYPPGVDPNGRIFGEDECGKPYVIDTCPTPIDGLVRPTGVPGPCGTIQNDLMLLGNNQRVVDTHAIARIQSDTLVVGVAAEAGPAGGTGTGDPMEFGLTSALNGITFAFTLDERKEGFDEATGTLTIFLNSNLATEADFKVAVDSAIAANWEGIRAFTGSTLLIPGVEEKFVAGTLLLVDARADADVADAVYKVGSVDLDGTVWTDSVLGVKLNDPALLIKAKDVGTDMAGVNIYFVQDDTMTAWAGAGNNMTLAVEYKVLENGEKQLVIRGNMDPSNNDSVNGVDLANSLNANLDFQGLFEAIATLNAVPAVPGVPDDTEAAGAVAFRYVNTNPHGVTEGGYRIESAYDGVSKPMATSSGISMFGQADNNERLVIESENLGSREFVNVNVVKGYLNTVDEWGNNTGYSYGSDMLAMINGNRATAQGNNLSINTSGLSMSLTADNYPGFSGFTITGGGALFQLGPDVVSQQQVRIGIASMLTSAIGGNNGRLYQLKSGESASVEGSDGSRKLADRIVNDAISYVANARGRLGAFQRGTLEPNIAALQDSMVALAEAEAMYTNADFAVESSNLTRLQLLIQAGMQTLGIANQIPQYAAALIR